MQRLREGKVLSGRYCLRRKIASGGMADVWEALDEVLQRTVAVKLMRPHGDDDAAFRHRFRIEAQHSAALSHPNIATVHDYGEYDDLAFLVMELVDGETLSTLLKDRGRLDPVTVRSVLSQAALGLATAHEARVVHRDIKPGNIMVNRQGQVKLTDFGIARAVDSVGDTLTGQIIGTPNYLSPEQGMGQRATEASDVYSLGVVAYELLTGDRPFNRESPVATMMAHVNDELPPLPEQVPEDLRLVVEQCLAKEPAKRPPSARAVAAHLGIHEVATHWSTALSTIRDTQTRDHSGTGSWSTPTPVTPLTPVTIAHSPLEAAQQSAWVAPGEQLRDLEAVLAGLRPRLNKGEFALVSITEPVEGLTPSMSLIEPEGLTLLIPLEQATEHGLDFELPLAWITLDVARSLGTHGYVPTLTTALAQAKIASVAGAGRWHTHLFVPHHQAAQAVKVLTRLSRAHRDD